MPEAGAGWFERRPGIAGHGCWAKVPVARMAERGELCRCAVRPAVAEPPEPGPASLAALI